MVNPERLTNAVAAFDILARADATAFVRGRSDAYPKPGEKAHTLMQIEQEGRYDAKKGLTPYCPYSGAERAAYIRGWKSGGGSNFAFNDSASRSDASGEDAVLRRLRLDLKDVEMNLANPGKNPDPDVIKTWERRRDRLKAKITETQRNDAAAPMSVREAKKLGKEYVERGNSRQRLMEVLRAEGADGAAMRAGLEAYDAG